MAASIVHHFSEDPSIVRFEPHVPKTNPTQQPAVWAIDSEHAPLYWFPRDCPRVTVWPGAGGYWISREVVEPVAIMALGNLIDAHDAARIELRLVPNLWPLVGLVQDGQWDFGCVRMVNAAPPETDLP